jgi:hypothetical protein
MGLILAAVFGLAACASDGTSSGGGSGGVRPPQGLGQTCGGIAALQCGDTLYCAYPQGAPFPDQAGTCQSRPKICPQVFIGVCGRDGQTYPNACIANSRGVSVAHAGRC